MPAPTVLHRSERGGPGARDDGPGHHAGAVAWRSAARVAYVARMAEDVGHLARGCILRRMPRMQVYLPDDLYKLVKKGHLPASELLQNAVRAEVRRRQLLAEGEKYVAELLAQVGEPTARQRQRASETTRQIVGHRRRRQVG